MKPSMMANWQRHQFKFLVILLVLLPWCGVLWLEWKMATTSAAQELVITKDTCFPIPANCSIQDLGVICRNGSIARPLSAHEDIDALSQKAWVKGGEFGRTVWYSARESETITLFKLKAPDSDVYWQFVEKEGEAPVFAGPKACGNQV